MWWLLPVAALLAALYVLGILSVQLAVVSIGWNWGLPRWWRGRYTILSGRLIRCFAASGNRFLTVRLEGEAGTVSLEIRDGTGSLQSAWYGVRSLDTRVPLRGVRRCTVHLRATDFRGSFFLALER